MQASQSRRAGPELRFGSSHSCVYLYEQLLIFLEIPIGTYIGSRHAVYRAHMSQPTECCGLSPVARRLVTLSAGPNTEP